MSGTFDKDGQLDPSQSIIVSAFGKKRSGKSIVQLMLFRQYPYDKVVIDVAADDGPWGPDVVELHGTAEDLPRHWPEHLRKYGPDGEPLPMILRYVPDPGSATELEDMDAVVGLALQHGKKTGHCGLLVHEVGRLTTANKTPPHTRRFLMHNRHHHVTGFLCGPRPQDIDTLVLAQSDLVYIFETPNPRDRERVAGTIGWPPRDFAEAVHGLRPHGYLLFDANQPKPEEGQEDYRLVDYPGLPIDVVAETKRWAQGGLVADQP
jgi:hypothetical protein